MSSMEQQINILIGDIRVSPNATDDQITEQAKKEMKRAGVSVSSLHFRLYKKSIDARKQDTIRLVCTVLVQPTEPLSQSVISRISSLPGVRVCSKETLSLLQGTLPLTRRPLIVGMGPAGLFCALLLAENGYAPILIDRGDCVADRVRAVENFIIRGTLDTDSNIQFGAGGAGTFSDGKLVTRISDARCDYVLTRLHEFGAPEDILVKAKPHIGTDVLRVVVDRILERIQACGGQVLYRTRMDGVTEHSDGTLTVTTSKGDFVCGALVLALGHSARDTYQMLISRQFAIVPKPMSVGVRIEHLQEDIDRALYGKYAGHPSLGPAEYTLSDTKGERGVYTFCMCPGGQVVAAASEEGGVVVNGMSYHARDGKNANCAVAVSVSPSEYGAVDGNAALGAIAYQRNIERAAFAVGGRDYSAPVQTLGDFMDDVVKHEPSRVLPTYRNGEHICVANLAQVLPHDVVTSLRYGLASFDRKIKGFAAPDAVLTAPETRTSAPVRILRGEDYAALGHERIYPCGEGAGYAGGITSAAVDGLKIAQAIVAKYAPPINQMD